MSETETSEFQFKLISVAFKEAALDSPTFRATVNFLDSQLNHTQRWFLALFASFAKVPKQLVDFTSVLSLLDYLVPSFLQDGVLDQEYVVDLLRDSRDSLKVIWTQAISAFHINVPYMENIKKELVDRMYEYSSLREAFLVCQEKYDKFYAIHMGTSKVREADWLLEHSMALANIRKDYMKMSLDLVVEMFDLTHFINDRLLTLNFHLWKGQAGRQKTSSLAPVSDIWSKVLRTKAFYDLDKEGLKNLSKDLMAAKKNVEVHTIEQLQPSTNPSDYRSNLLNRKMIEDTDELSVEKMGYVCMKTWAPQAPSKPIWVKRWAFIQDGILGFLVLSPDTYSVQETDKFGVLLCNVKYCPNEDRQFCFEVKTKDMTLVLQAESLKELKSWLKVFQNAKNRVVDESDDMHNLLSIASGRYPPLVMELQSSQNTVTDRNITSTKLYNSQGQLITSSKLSTYLERSEAFFQRHTYDKIARIYLPFTTETTKSSIMAYSLIGSTIVPTAMNANMTGSINWGLYHMFTAEQKPAKIEQEKEKEKEGKEKTDEMAEYTKQIGGAGIRYPSNYPNEWIAKDYQLRALFEYAVDPSECCLVAYNCLLSPNKSQQLRATQFFTHRFFYSYVHSMGFVSMCKIPIDLFVSAQCAGHKHHDDLLLTLVKGKFKTKLFLDDGVLVEKKLNFLFNAIASGKSGILYLIESLVALDKAHAKSRALSVSPHPQARVPSASAPIIHENGIPLDNSYEVKELVETQKQHKPKNGELNQNADICHMSSEFTVDLPPKALFHVLCGSESTILNEVFLLTHLEYDEINLWRKPADGQCFLVKENVLEYSSNASTHGRFTVKQEVEKYIEGELFSLRISGQPFTIKCGPSFHFIHRILVRKTMGNRSNIKFFCDVQTSQYSLWTVLVYSLRCSFQRSFISLFKSEVSKAVGVIGHKGETPRAAYFYGKIAVEPNDSKIAPRKPLLGPIISRWVFLKFYVTFVATQTKSSVSALVSIIFGVLSAFFQKISMHSVLVGIIVLLSFSNVFLGGSNIRHYWEVRHSGQLAEKLVSVDTSKLQRAVYLKDVQELVYRDLSVGKNSSESQCFGMFEKNSFILNYNNDQRPFQTSQARASDDKLRQALVDISIQRNELLLTLNMLNGFEEELARTEWRNWLVNEKATCERLKSEGILEGHELAALDSIEDYCASCMEEYASLRTQNWV